MPTQHTSAPVLEETKVPLKLKLAMLWTSLMFLYLYIDYFAFYMPGKIEGILHGIVFKFQITQGFLMAAFCSMSIPTLMIFLSVALPAKPNRIVNLVVASVFIPYTLFNLTGETWAHMVVAASLEVLLLGVVIVYAWKWPKTTN